jgi:hypothetical protein
MRKFYDAALAVPLALPTIRPHLNRDFHEDEARLAAVSN